MKSCPACHRSVPDNATTCPHPACGHRFGQSHASIKRPPPPPTRIQVTAANSRGASSPTAAKPLSTGEPNRWRRPLVLLAAILLTSGLTAALTALWLRGDQKQQVAATKGIAPQAEPKADSNSAEPAAQQPPVIGAQATRRQGDGGYGATERDGAAKQDGGVSPPKVDVPPKTPEDDDVQQPLGITAESRKTPMPGPPLGLVPEPKPDPLAVPNEPERPVVADTPEGLYAARTKPKTAEFLAERGGTIESQKAVEDGLNWLARHQGANGHWGADCLGPGPSSRCNRKAPCRVPGWTFDVAHTGLALLAFQAAGHYHFNDQKYSSQVKSGLDYLLRKQSFEGSFSDSNTPNPKERSESPSGSNVSFMYEHAMATFAMCESCAVALADGKTPNPRYQRAAQRAVSYIENIQHDDGGWRYTVNASEQSDCSVSGWVMLALKTAREAKLNVAPKTISRMMEFFAAHYADGRTFYQFRGYSTSDAMTAVGMMAVEFFEHKLDSPVVQTGATYLADQADVFAVMTTHPVGARRAEALFDIISNDHGYNCTMAMFQVGGEPWKRWNEAIRDRAVALQVRGDGCDRGSWSPDHDPYGDLGGRIYSTALAVLTLEVYYRFQRVADQPEKENFFEK